MEYKILSSTSLSSLAVTVTEHLRQGWKPQGGLVTDSPSGAIKFYQAMINWTEDSLPSGEEGAGDVG